MLKIEHLHIQNINGFKEIFLPFNPGINIISGPNGIGKTTILNSIYASIVGVRKSFKLDVRFDERYGECNIYFSDDYMSREAYFYVERNQFDNKYKLKNSEKIRSKDVIYFNVYNRNLYNGMYGKNNLNRLKKWLYQNYYHRNIGFEQYENAQLIKQCFYELDSKINYGRIVNRQENSEYFSSFGSLREGVDLELLVDTPYGEISFENLSSGYISCLSIMLGIIRAVETSNKRMYVQEYDGLILIDELDLHLHPEWQAKILNLLRWLVPYAQIIASTHSPHLIQGANANEIIPLEKKSDQKISIRQAPASNEYGYQGWTIEEILTEVMGLKNPMSILFKEVLKEFEDAKKSGNHEELIMNYKILSRMIHPENPLLKLLSIQSGEVSIWEGLKYDSLK